MNIKEKILKDQFERYADLSMDVTKVVVDTRAPTHDVINVYVRGMVAGRLVTDKSDSTTIARRLIPESLRYDVEPSSLMGDFEKLVDAYFNLLVEARVAARTGSSAALAKFLREGNDPTGLGVIPSEYASSLLDRLARAEDARTQQVVSPSGNHNSHNAG